MILRYFQLMSINKILINNELYLWKCPEMLSDANV